MGGDHGSTWERSIPPGSGERYWLDVRRRGLGWEFVVGATVSSESTGWRPTKGWAKRAGKRRIRQLNRRR